MRSRIAGVKGWMRSPFCIWVQQSKRDSGEPFTNKVNPGIEPSETMTLIRCRSESKGNSAIRKYFKSISFRNSPAFPATTNNAPSVGSPIITQSSFFFCKTASLQTTQAVIRVCNSGWDWGSILSNASD